MQDGSNSSVLAMELLQSCTKPSIYASSDSVARIESFHRIDPDNNWQLHNCLLNNEQLVMRKIPESVIFSFTSYRSALELSQSNSTQTKLKSPLWPGVLTEMS